MLCSDSSAATSSATMAMTSDSSQLSCTDATSSAQHAGDDACGDGFETLSSDDGAALMCHTSPPRHHDCSTVLDNTSTMQVLYAKDGVAVHPSPRLAIAGRLTLVQQHDNLFLSWLPYAHATACVAPSQRAERSEDHCHQSLYAIRPVPLQDIKAIRKHTPTLAAHYIIVVLQSGLTLPPLYFQYGGVKGMLSVLKQRALIVKSVEDSNLYIVNDGSEMLQGAAAVCFDAAPATAHSTATSYAADDHAACNAAAPQQAAWMDATAWSLDALARFALDTTASWLAADSHSAPRQVGTVDGDAAETVLQRARAFVSKNTAAGAHARRAQRHACARDVASDRLPAEVLDMCDDPGAPLKRRRSGVDGTACCACRAEDVLDSTAATEVGVFEVIDHAALDDAGCCCCCAPAVTLEEWPTFFDCDGCIDMKAFKARVYAGGIEPTLRREAWKFLLAVYPPQSTCAQRRELMAAKQREYKRLKRQWHSITPDQEARWAKWRERKVQVDKDVQRTDRSHTFYAGRHNAALKQLRAVLLTYVMYDFDCGYCQGMSDLASPLLYVMRDEADAFWCFVALMSRVGSNFDHDQRSMQLQLHAVAQLVHLLDPQLYQHICAQHPDHPYHAYHARSFVPPVSPTMAASVAAVPMMQGSVMGLSRMFNGVAAAASALDAVPHSTATACCGVQESDSMSFLCCFRWLLVLFKREFAFDDVLRCWEALWSNPHSRWLHLFMCVAVLEQQRSAIMANGSDAASTLQTCNDVRGKLHLQQTMRDAEALLLYAGHAGLACLAALPP